VLSDVAFTRSGKMSLESTIKYPLVNCGKTTTMEAKKFIRREWGDNNMDISKQAISDRRQYIDPRAYRDMNNDLMRDIYTYSPDLETFKGFYVCAIDGSIIDIPNVKLTREEFEIPDNTDFRNYTSTARVSCMVDALMDFTLSSNITYRDVNEIEHAIMHLEDVKKRLNLSKVITMYDRAYNSLELMLKTSQLDSYFIIRSKTTTFKKQQEKMKTDDEIFPITLNNYKINKIKDSELKKYAEEKQSMEIRIVKVKLKNGTIETLLTNIPEETASAKDLKELYGKRWTIETNYDRLKNKIQIENFSGRRKIIIEQDFYSHIYILNILIGLKHDAEDKIQRKPKKKNKHEYKYKTNINTLIGEIKEKLPDLLNIENPNEKHKIIKDIIDTASQNLVYTKINPPTNDERNKKKQYKSKYKSNHKPSF
jgi:hypothetical protein